MPISVKCPCGKQYRVRDELAGKRAKCSACGQAITVPVPEPLDSDPRLDDLSQLPTAPPTVRPGPSPEAHRKRKSSIRDVRFKILARVAAGVVFVVAVSTVMLLWPSRENVRTAREVVPPDRADASALEGSTTPDTRESSDPGDVSTSPLSPGDTSELADDGSLDAPPRPLSADRQFPGFPRAMTQIPDWLGTDVPFDVDEFFKTPPAEENAAELYLDALFEFHPPPELEPYWIFSQEETQRRVEQVQERVERLDEFVEHNQGDMTRMTWWAENADEVRPYLDAFAPGLEKLRTAQQRPQCVFESELSFLALGAHAVAARRVGQVLNYRTLLDLAEGDVDRAMNHAEMILRLCRDLRRRGPTSVQENASRLERICFQSIVPPILSSSGIEPEHCDRLMAILDRHETHTVDPLMESYRAEYIVARKALYDMRHLTGEFEPQFMQVIRGTEESVENPAACLNLLLRTRHFRSTVAFDQWRWSDLSGAERQQKYDDFDVHVNVMSDAAYAEEVAAVNRCYELIMALGDKTGRERAAHLPDAPERLRGSIIAAFLEPDTRALPREVLHASALVRGTKCLVASYRWHLRRLSVSSDLDEIVRDAGMPGVPLDPYSDQPLKMTKTKQRPVIYSVGPNGKDARATIAWNGDARNPSGDIVFPLNVGAGNSVEAAQKRYNQGVEHAKSDDFEAAIGEFDEALHIKPEFALAHATRGYIYFLQDRLDEALEDLDEAIRLDRELVAAYEYRAQVYTKQGLQDEAARDRDEAARLKSLPR